MHRVAAVVILYNPDKNVLNNINLYINQVEKLYVIDNSENINNVLVDKILTIDKAVYIPNHTNIGIAAALNIGVKKAIEDGFEYLLTMDQDSEVSSSMVLNLLDCFEEDSEIAIVAPIIQHTIGRNHKQKVNKSFEQVFTVWTSGNLLNLSIVKTTDGFKEELFIDYVDHEFCLRLNKMGYKILVCYNEILKHNLGKIEEKDIFFRKVYPTNHPALRIYYRARNRFYVKSIYKNKFPDFFKWEKKEFWKTFLKVIFFEKHKYEKIKYFLWGYLDYKKNKFGKFERLLT